MEFRPILNALMRNKTGLLLIVLQVAITLAIVCNSVFIILQRIEKVNRPSGMDEAEPVHRDQPRLRAQLRPARQPARRTWMRCARFPAWSTRPRSTPCRCRRAAGAKACRDQPDSVPQDKRMREGSAIYMVDEHGVNTLGVKLVAGRDFNAGDVSARTKDDKGTLHSVDHHPGAGRQAVPRAARSARRSTAACPARTGRSRWSA